MKNSEVSTHSKCTELWLPSFKLEGVHHQNAALRKWQGLALKGSSEEQNLYVSDCKQVVHIETCKGLPPKESLMNNPTESSSSNRCVIDKPFLFGKITIFINIPYSTQRCRVGGESGKPSFIGWLSRRAFLD